MPAEYTDLRDAYEKLLEQHNQLVDVVDELFDASDVAILAATSEDASKLEVKKLKAKANRLNKKTQATVRQIQQHRLALLRIGETMLSSPTTTPEERRYYVETLRAIQRVNDRQSEDLH